MAGEQQDTTQTQTASGAAAVQAEVSPEQLHETAYGAVQAWQDEPDEVKRGELKTKATEAVGLARKALEAQKAAAVANKLPDKYELALPKESLLDPKQTEEVAAFAKEHKLSQVAAAKVLERENAAVNKFFDKQRADVAAAQAQWAKDNLEAVGGDEAKLGAMAERAKRVVTRFDGVDGPFSKELQSTGLGNHPLLLAFMDKIGAAMADDKIINAGSETPEKKSTESLLFAKSLQDSAAK